MPKVQNPDVEPMDDTELAPAEEKTAPVESKNSSIDDKKAARKRLEERVKVTIASDPNDPCGNVDVTLGVNGVVVRVKRDVPVMLKRKFLGPLTDAVKKVYTVGDNGEITGERLVPRFNYTIHG